MKPLDMSDGNTYKLYVEHGRLLVRDDYREARLRMAS